ncbi:MAG: hypothetical protein V4591_00650 [Bdellovibrionota bacterium]
MTFRFSLQKILELRKTEAMDAQKQVNETQSSIFKLKELLEREKNLYFSDRDGLNIVVQKFEATEIKIYEKSLAIRQSKMMDLLKSIRDVQNELKIQERNLMQAKLNQRVIEKLSALREKEYEAEQTRNEQYLLDEMAALSFIKSRLEDESNE